MILCMISLKPISVITDKKITYSNDIFMRDWENISKIEDEMSQNLKSRLRKIDLIVRKEINSTHIGDSLESCSARESFNS